jgi:GntR family transcriptional regulator
VELNSLTQLFSLNPSSGIPIYRQLIDQVKQSIRMNLIEVGQQLPSVRNLAKELQINPMTISKAFAQLEVEGILDRKRGVGMIVAAHKQEQVLSMKVESKLKKFLHAAKAEGFNDDQISILVQQYLSINQDKQDI